MSSTKMNVNDAILALDSIRALLVSLSETKQTAAPVKAKKAAAKSADAASSDGESKPKRAINPKIAEMNVERKALFEEMKADWARKYPLAVSMPKDELKKAIADGSIAKPPSYPDALKEHSRRLRENNPEAEARHQSYMAKKAAKEPAPPPKPAETASVASSDSKKRRGPKPYSELTAEEIAADKATRAERKAARETAYEAFKKEDRFDALS